MDLEKLIKDEEMRDAIEDVIKAVAHVGIDFGYGVFELQEEHISKARMLYESNDNHHPERG